MSDSNLSKSPPQSTEELPRNGMAVMNSFLDSHEVLCPRCRQQLRGVSSPRCPECGVSLELTLVGQRWLEGRRGLLVLANMILLSFSLSYGLPAARAVVNRLGSAPAPAAVIGPTPPSSALDVLEQVNRINALNRRNRLGPLVGPTSPRTAAGPKNMLEQINQINELNRLSRFGPASGPTYPRPTGQTTIVVTQPASGGRSILTSLGWHGLVDLGGWALLTTLSLASILLLLLLTPYRASVARKWIIQLAVLVPWLGWGLAVGLLSVRWVMS